MPPTTYASLEGEADVAILPQDMETLHYPYRSQESDTTIYEQVQATKSPATGEQIFIIDVEGDFNHEDR